MGLLDVKLGEVKVPLFDIGAFMAGFYTGYCEGKGIDINTTLASVAKYGPTAVALTATPLYIALMKTFMKWTQRRLTEEVQAGSLEVTLRGGLKKKYTDLDVKERKKVTSKVGTIIGNLESRLRHSRYVQPTLSVGTKTAVETLVGYAAGRLYSQIS